MSCSESFKGEKIMNDVLKGMLFVLIVLYVISPVDFFPGPIDDVIVAFCGIAAQKQLGRTM
jgi:uncharacterized membrane protein YkvA (DUF1232 family)